MKLFIVFILVCCFSRGHSQPVKIGLYATGNSFFRNEPLVIKVSVSNPQAQYAERWNTAARQRLNALDDLVSQ